MHIDSRSDDWRELRVLFGVYLNQDFPDDYGSPEAAVLAFCRRRTAQERAVVVDEVRRILDGTADDDDTLRALEPFGRDYHPEGIGWSIREWLRELEGVLRDPERPTRLDDRPGHPSAKET